MSFYRRRSATKAFTLLIASQPLTSASHLSYGREFWRANRFGQLYVDRKQSSSFILAVLLWRNQFAARCRIWALRQIVLSKRSLMDCVIRKTLEMIWTDEAESIIDVCRISQAILEGMHGWSWKCWSFIRVFRYLKSVIKGWWMQVNNSPNLGLSQERPAPVAYPNCFTYV